MGERYWITGAQLGLMKYGNNQQTINQVIGNQFIGNFHTDKDKKVFNKLMADLIKKAETQLSDQNDFKKPCPVCYAESEPAGRLLDGSKCQYCSGHGFIKL